MIRLISGTTARDLEAAIASARESILLCAPFISAIGVDIVARSATASLGPRSLVLTNFNATAISAGAVDPNAVSRLTIALPGIQVVHLPRLHAKVYAADRSVAFVTSANLTAGGMRANLEYGIAIHDPVLVDQIRSEIGEFRTLGTQLTAEALAAVCDAATDIHHAMAAQKVSLPAEVSGRLRRALDRAQDQILRSYLAEGPVHRVFARTIEYLLKKHGAMKTIELHTHIQSLHPDLCDDTVDRVIDGESFGKKWKHQVRSAQSYLKKAGIVILEDDKWRHVNQPPHAP